MTNLFGHIALSVAMQLLKTIVSQDSTNTPRCEGVFNHHVGNFQLSGMKKEL